MSIYIKPSQKGSILIVVLWFFVLAAVIVTSLASHSRLSAKTVFHNKKGMQQWSATVDTLNKASMEIILERMPKQIRNNDAGKDTSNPLYKFNGRMLDLYYKQDESSAVRIFDHAGKINLRRLTRKKFEELLEKRPGSDEEQIDSLLDSWQDWIDKDDLKRLNGAEKDYYQTQEPPYEPRNGKLESVDEILSIRGFEQAFKDVDVYSVFTIYGSSTQINPNLASPDTLLLVPGLDEEMVKIIIDYRNEGDIKTLADLAEILPPEVFLQARTWLGFGTSTYYTIAIYKKNVDTAIQNKADAAAGESSPINLKPWSDSKYAYMATIKINGYQVLPTFIMIRPYGVIPMPVTANRSASAAEG